MPSKTRHFSSTLAPIVTASYRTTSLAPKKFQSATEEDVAQCNIFIHPPAMN